MSMSAKNPSSTKKAMTPGNVHTDNLRKHVSIACKHAHSHQKFLHSPLLSLDRDTMQIEDEKIAHNNKWSNKIRFHFKDSKQILGDKYEAFPDSQLRQKILQIISPH